MCDADEDDAVREAPDAMETDELEALVADANQPVGNHLAGEVRWLRVFECGITDVG